MKAFEKWREQSTDTSLTTKQRQHVTMNCYKCQAHVWKAALEWMLEVVGEEGILADIEGAIRKELEDE